MATSTPAMSAANLYDLGAYTSDGSLILLGEVKASSDASAEGAQFLRQNLISHELLPRRVYFMLANRRVIFLWRPHAAVDALPDFQTPAEPVLRKFLGSSIRPEDLGEAAVEAAINHWLNRAARHGALPDSNFDADQMLVQSGLYPLLKGGEIRYELAA